MNISAYPLACCKHLANLVLLLATLTASLAATAQNEFSLSELERGQVLLNFSITEEVEVEQDLLTVHLQYTARGRDQTAVQNEVNTAMAAALEQLETGSEALDYSTGHYQVYIINPPGSNRRDLDNPTWQAQQSIRISSLDSGELLAMAGSLQADGLTISSLSYSLSPQQHREISASLLESALTSLQQRADATARAMNKGSAELIEVSLNDSLNRVFRQEAMRTLAADAMTNPVAEPGTTTVSLSISARALLSP